MKMESKGCRWFFQVFLCKFSQGQIWNIEHLKSLCTRIQVEIGNPIVRIKSDSGREFDNVEVDLFYELKEIKHNILPLELLNKMEW